MAIFCERILAGDRKVVTNRGDLTGFVPFYSGTKSVQSFAKLSEELKSVPWVHCSHTPEKKQCRSLAFLVG
eukprot:2679643-Amphidinium_carterae.1